MASPRIAGQPSGVILKLIWDDTDVPDEFMFFCGMSSICPRGFLQTVLRLRDNMFIIKELKSFHRAVCALARRPYLAIIDYQRVASHGRHGLFSGNLLWQQATNFSLFVVRDDIRIVQKDAFLLLNETFAISPQRHRTLCPPRYFACRSLTVWHQLFSYRNSEFGFGYFNHLIVCLRLDFRLQQLALQLLDSPLECFSL